MRRIPPKIFTVLKRSELAFEIVFIIGAIVSQALQLFARIYGGDCAIAGTRTNSTFCNPEYFADALPQDTAFALILLPGLLKSAVKTPSAVTTSISWMLSFALLIAAVAYADAWRSSSVLILFSFVEMVRMFSGHQQFVRMYLSVQYLQEELRQAKLQPPQPSTSRTPETMTKIEEKPKSVTPTGEMAEKAIQIQTLLANLDEYLLSPLNALLSNAEELVTATRSAVSILKKLVPPPSPPKADDGGIGAGTGSGTGSSSTGTDSESKSLRKAGAAADVVLEMELRNRCGTALSYLTPCAKMLDHILTSTKFMIATVSNKLAHTKTRQAPTMLVPQFRTVNILEAVEWCISCMQNKNDGTHEFFVRELPENVFPYIITDGHWLNENILCMLSNAMKNSFGGKVEISIKLEVQSKRCSFNRPASSRNSSGRKKSLQPSASVSLELIERLVPQPMIRFDIYDSGIGIDPEIMRKVFLSPFERGDWSSKIKGVGLYNMFRRVDSLGGACGIAPRPDGQDGTVCWFSEPYRPDLNPTLPHQHSSNEAGLDTIDEQGGKEGEDSLAEASQRVESPLQALTAKEVHGEAVEFFRKYSDATLVDLAAEAKPGDAGKEERSH